MIWKLAEAKNKFSEVVQRALNEGPQHILRRNDEVVLVSKKDFDHLRRVDSGFFNYLTQGPTFESLDLRRERSSPREVDL